MGAQVDVRTFDHKPTRDELGELVEECAWESGHGGYSGTFAECPGFTFRRETFDTIRQAEDFIEDRAQKWENALVVQVGDSWLVGGIFSS